MHITDSSGQTWVVEHGKAVPLYGWNETADPPPKPNPNLVKAWRKFRGISIDAPWWL